MASWPGAQSFPKGHHMPPRDAGPFEEQPREEVQLPLDRPGRHAVTSNLLW